MYKDHWTETEQIEMSTKKLAQFFFSF
jgi:hypothetical protein